MAAALSPERKAKLERDLKRRGNKPSVRDYATKHGVSSATVVRYAQTLGVDFGDAKRSATENATRATRAANKERLAILATELLDEAFHFKAKLHKPWIAYSFGGRFNDYAEHIFDEPDATAAQKFMTSIAIAVDKIAVIEKQSTSSGEHAASQFATWLASLVDPVGEYDPAGIS